MNKIEKWKGLSLKSADAAADIGLINQFAVKDLTPEEVYCFNVTLTNNEVDRDFERLPDESLEALAKFFVGKTGISDHRWSADRQFSRIYRCEVRDAEGKNSLGEPMKELRASAYMIRNETNQPIIDAIEGGILKEVSIGFSSKVCRCSICKEPQEIDWRTWTYQCETGHIKGETYDGKLCVGELVDIEDAYEFSLVAVPAVPGAGITKSAKNVDEAFELLMTADLRGADENIKKLMPKLQTALMDQVERQERAAAILSAEKFTSKSEV